MDALKLLGQAGIIVELIGAAFLVLRAKASSAAMATFPEQQTYDSMVAAIDRMVAIMKKQHADQRTGFIFIGAGLAMQFVSGLR